MLAPYERRFVLGRTSAPEFVHAKPLGNGSSCFPAVAGHHDYECKSCVMQVFYRANLFLPNWIFNANDCREFVVKGQIQKRTVIRQCRKTLLICLVFRHSAFFVFKYEMITAYQRADTIDRTGYAVGDYIFNLGMPFLVDQAAHCRFANHRICDGVRIFQRRTDNGRWGLIGGLVEMNETYTQAALREIREETGLEVQLESFLGIFHNHNIMVWSNGDAAHVISAMFTTRVASGEPRIDEESYELRFFGKEELPDVFAEDHIAGRWTPISGASGIPCCRKTPARESGNNCRRI